MSRVGIKANVGPLVGIKAKMANAQVNIRFIPDSHGGQSIVYTDLSSGFRQEDGKLFSGSVVRQFVQQLSFAAMKLFHVYELVTVYLYIYPPSALLWLYAAEYDLKLDSIV